MLKKYPKISENIDYKSKFISILSIKIKRAKRLPLFYHTIAGILCFLRSDNHLSMVLRPSSSAFKLSHRCHYLYSRQAKSSNTFCVAPESLWSSSFLRAFHRATSLALGSPELPLNASIQRLST